MLLAACQEGRKEGDENPAFPPQISPKILPWLVQVKQEDHAKQAVFFLTLFFLMMKVLLLQLVRVRANSGENSWSQFW
jgi:hypothetical protein